MKAYPKKLVSFLLALLIAETAAFAFYVYSVHQQVRFTLPDMNQLVASLPKLPLREIDLFRSDNGAVLGTATSSSETLESAKNVATKEASPSATTSPSPTVTAPPSPTPTPKPAFSIYTVKTGDNWWQIIRKQCPDAKAQGDLVIYNQSQNEPTLHRGDNVKVYCVIP